MEPHEIAIVSTMASTPEERHRLRCLAGAGLARIVEYTISRGLIHKLDPEPEAMEWERVQRAHITRYMRKPHNPLFSTPEYQMGGRIDRASLAICDMIQAWDSLTKTRRSKAYRKMRETERQAQRQTKLLQRRKRQAEKQIGLAPRPKTKKVVEHEEVERCAKCHKRPAVKSGLCDPCFAWEHATLGRE